MEMMKILLSVSMMCWCSMLGVDISLCYSVLLVLLKLLWWLMMV